MTNIKKKLKRKDITLKPQTEILRRNEELMDLLESELEKRPKAAKVPIVYADQWNAPAMPLLLLEQSEVNQSLVN